MSTRTHFLLISDSLDDYGNQVLQEALATLGPVHVVPENDTVSFLQEQACDIVIVDAGAVKNASKVVAQICKLDPDAKVVVVTASPHWKIARAVFLAGAKDYLYKSQNKEEILASFLTILE